MDHAHLLYVLEKVKAAARRGDLGDAYQTQLNSEDDQACIQLERDGLVESVGVGAEQNCHSWRLPGSLSTRMKDFPG